MSTPSPAPSLTPGGLMTAESVEQAMIDEFAAWEDALVRPDLGAVTKLPDGRVAVRPAPLCPHPCETGGLPDGWEMRWHGRYPRSGNPKTFDELVIVKRAGGGWTMVLHWLDAAGNPTSMRWMHTALTPAELYDTTDSRAGRESGPEQTVRDYLLTFYDLTDPAEAAEVTLAALGARITVFPKALVTP